MSDQNSETKQVLEAEALTAEAIESGCEDNLAFPTGEPREPCPPDCQDPSAAHICA